MVLQYDKILQYSECPQKWFSTQSEIRTPHTTYNTLVYQTSIRYPQNAYEPALGKNKTIPTKSQVELYTLSISLYTRPYMLLSTSQG